MSVLASGDKGQGKSLPVPHEFADGGKWQCYAEVRAKRKAQAGPAMTLGVYPLAGDCYLWLTPPDRPGDVDAVYVDRFFFMKPASRENAEQ